VVDGPVPARTSVADAILAGALTVLAMVHRRLPLLSLALELIAPALVFLPLVSVTAIAAGAFGALLGAPDSQVHVLDFAPAIQTSHPELGGAQDAHAAAPGLVV
jgi:hypothetical protein